MKGNEAENESRALKIKKGITRTRSNRGKWGRPTIIESKEDPDLPFKATEMRSQGLSWSEIADSLGIGRTTARRLVSLCQKDERGEAYRDE